MQEIKEFFSYLGVDGIVNVRTYESDSLVKMASEIEKSAESLAEDIYAEMQADPEFRVVLTEMYKEATFSGALKGGIKRVGDVFRHQYAPHVLAGAAGVGAAYAVGRSHAAKRSADNIAAALAAETAADIQGERMLGGEVVKNRQAILALARAMDQAQMKKTSSAPSMRDVVNAKMAALKSNS